MGALEAWQNDHKEICIKTHLLETALIHLLQSKINEKADFEQHKDFLEAFQRGLELHFTIEEQAFFPQIKQMGQAEQALVEELLVEHKAILEKCRVASETTWGSKERAEILIQIAHDLEAHTKKKKNKATPS